VALHALHGTLLLLERFLCAPMTYPGCGRAVWTADGVQLLQWHSPLLVVSLAVLHCLDLQSLLTSPAEMSDNEMETEPTRQAAAEAGPSTGKSQLPVTHSHS
jgi:hypothetical protein